MKKNGRYIGVAVVFSFSLFCTVSTIYAKKFPDSEYAAFYRKNIDEMGSQMLFYMQRVLSSGSLYHSTVIPNRIENYRLTSSKEDYLSELTMEIILENYAFQKNLPILKEKKERDSSVKDRYGFVYYNQADPQWADLPYGKDGNTIGVYGCGPTALASVISSLTDTAATPKEIADWAYEHGYYSRGSGSYHSLIPDGAAAFGLDVTAIPWNDADRISSELQKGRLIVALMAKGHFTAEGHFIVLRRIDVNGNLQIADPKSTENTNALWTVETIIEEAKRGASAGGPFWSIGKKEAVKKL